MHELMHRLMNRQEQMHDAGDVISIPGPVRRNPLLDAAARHNLQWLRAHGMLREERAQRLYEHWSIPELAATSFPDADLADLCLAVDQCAFYFLFDDQFDGERGARPAEVARVCAPLITTLHTGRAPERPSPVESAFADLWRRGSQGMSARWRARAAFHWEGYFMAHPSEALGRALPDSRPSRAAYLVLRRGASGVDTVLDLVERILGEVPATAYHNPQLTLMRQLAGDAPAVNNDVYSYAKEAPRGDVYNLAVITQRDRGISREGAFALVRDEAQRMVDEFFALSEQIPGTVLGLGCSSEEGAAVLRYVDGMGDWMRGYFSWEASTLRYRPEGALPVDQPNYVEELL
ncbi:terpene synthase family protein [Streptacidiphilus melanogenes]|uniref:terpene synthase family protein n=1 Tax=Streptacidiphilus melanogenes TaxID=411235 RepID=UPI00069483C9|nr:hypothetical protein [Streptacidiphilus melanogenes]